MFLSQLRWWLVSAGASLAVGAGAVNTYVEQLDRVPAPAVAPIDIRPLFFDLRPTAVVTTASWVKIPLTVERWQFLRDRAIWLRMHFEDWDELPEEARTEGLRRLLDEYGALATARRAWPRMSAYDWDYVPQPVRAMATVGMIEAWTAHYRPGETYGLDQALVLRTIKAIAMSESWYDHRAIYRNTDGSVDVGIGGASDFARRTMRRFYDTGWTDFSLSDDDYYNPWLASRWLVFWVALMIDEAEGDLELAVRAYNWGLGRAQRGAGEEYLAGVERRRRRYFEGPSNSPTWSTLSRFRRVRAGLPALPPLLSRPLGIAPVELRPCVEPGGAGVTCSPPAL